MINLIKWWKGVTKPKPLNWVVGSLPANDVFVAIDRGNKYHELGLYDDGQWSLVEDAMWGFNYENIDSPLRWSYE